MNKPVSDIKSFRRKVVKIFSFKIITVLMWSMKPAIIYGTYLVVIILPTKTTYVTFVCLYLSWLTEFRTESPGHCFTPKFGVTFTLRCTLNFSGNIFNIGLFRGTNPLEIKILRHFPLRSVSSISWARTSSAVQNIWCRPLHTTPLPSFWPVSHARAVITAVVVND